MRKKSFFYFYLNDTKKHQIEYSAEFQQQQKINFYFRLLFLIHVLTGIKLVETTNKNNVL